MNHPALRAAFALLFGFCLTGAHVAQAVTIQSANFSLGYGYFSPTANPTGTWNTSETSGSNTPTTQGDFTFLPTVTGGQFDSTGPGFPLRLLTDSGGWIGVSIAYPTQAGFSATILGSYNGVVPGNDPQIRINIDQISIYGIAHPSFVAGTENLAFSETTPGHTSSSPSLTLTPTGAYATAANFTQLVWSPLSFDEPGTSFSRTFVLLSDDLRGIDGFEIEGTIELTFQIPEPSTFALLGLGIVGLAIKRRRRSRS